MRRASQIVLFLCVVFVVAGCSVYERVFVLNETEETQTLIFQRMSDEGEVEQATVLSFRPGDWIEYDELWGSHYLIVLEQAENQKTQIDVDMRGPKAFYGANFFVIDSHGVQQVDAPFWHVLQFFMPVILSGLFCVGIIVLPMYFVARRSKRIRRTAQATSE